MKFQYKVLTVFWIVFSINITTIAMAGSIIGDVSPQDSIKFGARDEFQATGALVDTVWQGRKYFRVYCTASLISPTVVLTAAHCAVNAFKNFEQFKPGDLVFMIDALPDDGEHSPAHQSTVSKIYIHPDWKFEKGNNGPDLAVLKLASPINSVTPFIVNSKEDELDGDMIISLVGYGVHGDGANGCYGLTQGSRRGGQNVISSIGPSKYKPEVDHIVFDMKTRAELKGLPKDFMEYTNCAGDSGGPVLRKYNGQWTIIGVNESGYPTDATGPYTDLGIDPYGRYGETAYSTRVKPYSDWIKTTGGLQ
jgi:secreted trypsin-like serine protease